MAEDKAVSKVAVEGRKMGGSKAVEDQAKEAVEEELKVEEEEGKMKKGKVVREAEEEGKVVREVEEGDKVAGAKFSVSQVEVCVQSSVHDNVAPVNRVLCFL